MDESADALLDCTDGAFDFADVIVGGDNVELSGKEVKFEAIKFKVGMDVGNGKAAAFVKTFNEQRFAEESGFGSVRQGSDRAEIEFARDGVKERNLLDIENVHAKCEVFVMCHDRGREELRDQGGNMGGMVFGGSAFEVGNARAVDGNCALGVGGGNGTVANESFAEEAFEPSLCRTAEATV